VVIDKDGNTAIYLAFQSKEPDFDHLNTQIFQKMIDAIQLN